MLSKTHTYNSILYTMHCDEAFQNIYIVIIYHTFYKKKYASINS